MTIRFSNHDALEMAFRELAMAAEYTVEESETSELDWHLVHIVNPITATEFVICFSPAGDLPGIPSWPHATVKHGGEPISQIMVRLLVWMEQDDLAGQYDDPCETQGRADLRLLPSPKHPSKT